MSSVQALYNCIDRLLRLMRALSKKLRLHNREATSASLSARCVALAGDTTARSAAVLDATARDAECAVDARQVLSAQRALPSETSATERLPSAAFLLSESEAASCSSQGTSSRRSSRRCGGSSTGTGASGRGAPARPRLLQRRDLSRDAELASSCSDAQMRPLDPLSIAR